MLSVKASRFLLLCFRIIFVLLWLAVCIVTLGPFQGDERFFFLSDKEAHALAFYCLTLLFFMAAPRVPKLYIGGLCSLFGVAIEIIQGLTGRDAEFADWVADSFGVAMALLPLIFARLYHRRIRGDWRRERAKRG
ncbi:hypothetical protein AEAC466_21085 [Asticcacaulis sp. AC466]|uniref:VanZ family protein n=1 Tax=Asticcacaulis sp. AC466 TaxID=1282362 RepID=UPI0003C3BC8A|nr:VanZ family protein [Asticcacaulis sp. AC466]ESQ81575.1 hypothetical protein AEAC466_21085 [Asticcacaulis sp. AC466]